MENKIKCKNLIKNIAFFLGLTLMVSSHVFTQSLSNMDEIWIYNIARCMADGLLPYRDISMVITPLFPYVCSIILSLFGNEIIVLRFFECFEIAGILFMIYKIMRRLKIKGAVSIILTVRSVLAKCLYKSMVF